MKAPHFILVLLLLMWGVLAIAAMQSGPEHASNPHPEHGIPDTSTGHAAMDVGGEPFAGPWAWLFGCLIILVLSGSMWFATEQAPSSGLLRLAMACSTLVFLVAFTAMSWSDHRYAGRIAPLWGPFPEPTSWMIIGIWCPPLSFMLIYVLGFRRWFMPSESVKKSQGTQSP